MGQSTDLTSSKWESGLLQFTRASIISSIHMTEAEAPSSSSIRLLSVIGMRLLSFLICPLFLTISLTSYLVG
jgi:hypothetical protein